MKVMITLTGGGYLYEAMALEKEISNIGEFCYVTANDCAVPSDFSGREVYTIPAVTTVAAPGKLQVARKLISAIAASISVLRKSRPDVIVAVGTSLAVPLAIAGKFFCVQFIFVESITRVTSPSTTGRILSLLRLADRIYVQWPESERLYRGAIYKGTVL